MTEQELQRYAGQFVEVRFVDGRTAVGELIEGTALLQLRPHRFTLIMSTQSDSDDHLELNIPSAAVVESIRALE